MRMAVDERGALGQRGRVVNAVMHAGAKDVATAAIALKEGSKVEVGDRLTIGPEL